MLRGLIRPDGPSEVNRRYPILPGPPAYLVRANPPNSSIVSRPFWLPSPGVTWVSTGRDLDPTPSGLHRQGPGFDDCLTATRAWLKPTLARNGASRRTTVAHPAAHAEGCGTSNAAGMENPRRSHSALMATRSSVLSNRAY